MSLVKCLVRFLKKHGYRVRLEISNMGQSADVVATRGRWVMVVEAKLKDWSRAMRQCQAHEQVADYIAVAVALAAVPPGLDREARELGYGILHFSGKNGTIRWVVRPRLNRRVWAPQRRQWARSLKEVPYVH